MGLVFDGDREEGGDVAKEASTPADAWDSCKGGMMPVLPSDREHIDGAIWTHRLRVSKVLLELRFPTAIPRAVSKNTGLTR